MHPASAFKGISLLFLFLGFSVGSLDGAQQVHFIPHTIATQLRGGYQVVVADLNRDGKPDLIALASGMPELVWFENPGWQRHVIASNLTQMINCVVLTSSSTPGIVLASGFSDNAHNSIGNILLFEPGPDLLGPWKVREIDRLPTSHRLRLANIDGTGKPVVINAPLTAANTGPPEYRGHTPLVYYRPGDWKRMLISDENEGVQHGICVTDWEGAGREQILTASFSGIHQYKLQKDNRWTRTEITKGSPEPWPKCGASEVAVGRLGSRRFLCTIEPWHGNEVCVYVEQEGTWSRHLLDDSLQDGHALATADLNRDGRDEIVAGFRGGGGGLVFYAAEDQSGRHWKRHDLDVGGIAAASCAVVDLNGDGKPDIVAIGSSTTNLVWYENTD